MHLFFPCVIVYSVLIYYGYHYSFLKAALILQCISSTQKADFLPRCICSHFFFPCNKND